MPRPMTSTVRCHSLIPAPPGRGTRDAAERRRPAIRRRSKAREAPALAGRGRPARTLSPERNALAGSAHAASERASRLPRSRRSRRRAPPQAPRSRARSRCQMASSRSSAPAYSPVLSRPPLPRPAPLCPSPSSMLQRSLVLLCALHTAARSTAQDRPAAPPPPCPTQQRADAHPMPTAAPRLLARRSHHHDQDHHRRLISPPRLPRRAPARGGPAWCAIQPLHGAPRVLPLRRAMPRDAARCRAVPRDAALCRAVPRCCVAGALRATPLQEKAVFTKPLLRRAAAPPPQRPRLLTGCTSLLRLPRPRAAQAQVPAPPRGARACRRTPPATR
jgi:hypothetical protein